KRPFSPKARRGKVRECQTVAGFGTGRSTTPHPEGRSLPERAFSDRGLSDRVRTHVAERQRGHDGSAHLLAPIGRQRVTAEFGELEAIVGAPVGGADERSGDLRA